MANDKYQDACQCTGPHLNGTVGGHLLARVVFNHRAIHMCRHVCLATTMHVQVVREVDSLGISVGLIPMVHDNVVHYCSLWFTPFV